MATLFHAIGSAIYYNNSRCTVGNNIEKKNIRKGKEGKRLCKICQSLAGNS